MANTTVSIMVNITVNMGKITNNEKYVYGAKFRGGGRALI